ncbi:2,4-dienoyl-CoA reductase-like NADH-dependent reductase (Old Yellow Enzyme family) [Neobacillus niacini]|uniref:NADH:flavin oxidoreductase n=1 Tax=Neobacillus niacini TaxID=86668 RepID=UPI002863A5F8|nr:NADH:flavin oxidoreductase [Neobacillus niacini]MDR7076844.1 2,4-dienoyl-CoA reductase-like NADH-dependent reductase (Old Yellow Enzyme family) [Neobacillus niacini]
MLNTRRLFEPVTLGNTTLDNRVGVAPMTRTSATAEGLVTDQMISYYTSFAKGGFGLIITEGIYTDNQYSQCYFNQPGIIDEEQAQIWKKLVDSVHQAGAKIFMQLQHTGPLSQGNRFMEGTIAPSVVYPKGEQLKFFGGKGPFPLPKEATKKDIEDVIKGFVDSAKRAQSVGFDGVEIHGANGYLLDAFLTDYTNQRSDQYGGTTEKRVRLLVEVSEAVREAVGPNFTVGIRISQRKVNDSEHKWSGKEKDAEIIFGQLGKAGLDYIHVTEHKACKPAFDTSHVSLAAFAKKYGKIPVIANGNLEDPSKSSEMVEQGAADVVTLGKGALANHDWVNKVKNGEPLSEFNPAEVLRPTAIIKEFEVEGRSIIGR